MSEGAAHSLEPERGVQALLASLPFPTPSPICPFSSPVFLTGLGCLPPSNPSFNATQIQQAWIELWYLAKFWGYRDDQATFMDLGGRAQLPVSLIKGLGDQDKLFNLFGSHFLHLLNETKAGKMKVLFKKKKLM